MTPVITITIPLTEETKGLVEKLMEAGTGPEEKSIIRASDLKKKGRKPKEVEADEDEESDEIEETEEVEADEDEETEGVEADADEESEDDDEAEAISAKDLSQLKVALKVYSGKHGKDKAVKMLHKFAKASDKVSKTDLPKLLKLLKV